MTGSQHNSVCKLVASSLVSTFVGMVLVVAGVVMGAPACERGTAHARHSRSTDPATSKERLDVARHVLSDVQVSCVRRVDADAARGVTLGRGLGC